MGEREERKEITLQMNTGEVIMTMAEGNPGALSVLTSMLQVDGDVTKGFFTMLDLDDMNIRGSQIWVGFKDHCGSDLSKFMDCANKRDAAMVETVNHECAYTGEIAVTSGASFTRKSGPFAGGRNKMGRPVW